MTDLKLLLIEDEPEHMKMLIDALTSSRPGMQVTVAENGRRCLELVAESAFDCIVSDYNLPDYSADELLKVAGPLIHDTPVVVISSSIEQHVAVQAFRAGGVDFIPKVEALQGECLLRRIDSAVKAWRDRKMTQQGDNRRIQKLVRLSETDELTGLSNRHFFYRMVAQMQPQHRRRSLSISLVDIDHFKEINDRFGHAAGDAILKEMARIIRTEFLSGFGDAAIRWGGEEFLIVRSSESLTEHWIWAERFRKRIEGHAFQFEDHTIAATVSAGVSRLELESLDAVAIELIDHALYLAKSRGRNQICTTAMVFVEGTAKKSRESEKLEATLQWKRFIDLCRPTLGAGQYHHVFDHCKRVSQLAGDIAHQMRLAEQSVQQVQLGGLLHDVGKTIVPEDLLSSPHALSDDQRVVMKTHVMQGWRISRLLDADAEAVECVRLHHMRFDQRQGDQLPIGARILGAADALAAMTANRAYQAARGMDKAVEELGRCAGSQFDPDVVGAIRNMTDGPPALAMVA
jgi:diguanylate cyclase (GGDEF)-like protein/putative nucleotidyltransferase with HDIG domain